MSEQSGSGLVELAFWGLVKLFLNSDAVIFIHLVMVIP